MPEVSWEEWQLAGGVDTGMSRTPNVPRGAANNGERGGLLLRGRRGGRQLAAEAIGVLGEVMYFKQGGN